MSIIFGSLGVDRFMMGKIGTGILKLLTWGGFGVWWLIDVILIATKYKYANVEWVD
jgi:TM2 domain-containing membrane protein YozV